MLLEASANLRDKPNFQSLRFSDRLKSIENDALEFLRTGKFDRLNAIRQINLETNSSHLEGSAAFDTSIWDTEVNAKGKSITLDELAWDLSELSNEKKLKKHPQVMHWSNSFAHSYDGLDRLGGSPDEWILKSVDQIIKGKDYFSLTLNMKRRDGIEGRHYIRSQNKDFLEKLKEKLAFHIGLSWEEIGDLEI